MKILEDLFSEHFEEIKKIFFFAVSIRHRQASMKLSEN